MLLICDGVSHVQCRMGMLDIFLAFFVLMAFGCLLLDRDQVRARLAVAVREGWVAEVGVRAVAGFPLVAVRGRRVARSGVRVKWSGVCFIVAFGLLTVSGTRRPAGRPASTDRGSARS